MNGSIDQVVEAAVPPATRGRWRMLLLLTAALVICNIDRNIIAVLLEPIRHEFGLEDWQLGLLAGLTFTLLYAVGAVFVSRWADRFNRVNIISAGLLAWSAFTLVCGLAASFGQLLAARAAVGLSESSAQAPSHSLIADRFPGPERSLALAVYSSGALVGVMVALPIGGLLADSFGWRGALCGVSLPGVLLSMVIWLTLRDPRSVARAGAKIARPAPESMVGAVTALLRTPAVPHLILGGTLASFAGAAGLSFGVSVLVRGHGITPGQAGLYLGLANGISAVLGTVASGWLVSRLVARDPRWRAWAPMLAELLCIPAKIGFLLLPSLPLALASSAVSALLGAVWMGPTFAALQDSVEPRRRATAAALILISYNLVGFGLGPLAAGLVSDVLKSVAGPHALSWALVALQPFALWGAAHFFLASKRLSS